MFGGTLVFAQGGGQGRPLAFPVKNGRPVLISREKFEECCCWRPSFAPGAVSGNPHFYFRPLVDAARGFAYANQGTGEHGTLVRIDLGTGQVDVTPAPLFYGFALRPSDGSLFSWGSPGAVNRWLPHLWKVGDALSAVESGGYVAPELGVYSPDLDRVLIPDLGGYIRAFEPGNLGAGGTVYETVPTYFGVHAPRWEGGQLWWIEGDSSGNGGRWSVGGTVYTTGPAWGVDIVPLPDIGRAVLVGHAATTRGARVVDAASGAVIHSLPGHGSSSIGGCFRLGESTRVAVFDTDLPAIRLVDASDGTWEDIPVGSMRYGCGFWHKGKSVALPYSGAVWGDEDCGFKIF